MDQISKKLTVDGDTRKVISKAIAQANAELKSYFESGKSVAQVTTGSGAKAVSNKVELAHSYGFDTHLVLVDTDIERAINRNRKRTDSGVQTSVPDWKIEKTDLAARQTFKETRRIATKSTIIKN